tara:strand:+ start:103 stop:2589 length:2487 start_codon:yes stop_codon:yes gene_type:complete
LAIERSPATPVEGLIELEDEIEIETEDDDLALSIENPESISVETEDGGMIIDFDPNSKSDDEGDFNANLVNFIEERDLQALGSELIAQYEADRESRSDWEETYIKGLDQMGLKIEERTAPWAGACGVFHPMLSEAVIRFQSQAIGEIFPASGPVQTKIVGLPTPEKEKQASRVQDYMNYLLTTEMVEYRTETEKMLFSLPLAGSAFRKVYYDSNLGRPCGIFVPAEDVVVSYGASDLQTCARATQIMKKNSNDIRKMQVNGFYRDIELPESSPNINDITRKYNEMTGSSENYSNDDRHTLLEMQVDLDLVNFEDEQGIALPYVVTIDYPSGIILSIYRNYYEDDEARLRRMHFVHYQYLPGVGFYGFGLIHLIGGLAKSATSLLRQLVDAGTLSNLPGGLKARGLRIKGDDTPIMPGEFRDVDVPGGAIRDNITFLPYKEPSATLYQLLGNIVEEGRRFASLSDLKIGDMNQQAPVGTTLAILERGMKVMSAIQARLHATMKKEFEILVGVIKDFTSPEYPYAVDANQEIKIEDFDDRIDVLPVSDPNAATMSQRIMQYQAALQLSQQSPEMYNLPELHRQMLDTLGIHDADKIVPMDDDIPPTDPVTENMNIINGKGAQAFEYQDHEAHITVHMTALQDPKTAQMLQQSPAAGMIQGEMESHVREHLAFQYRKEIEDELGTELPPIGEELPNDLEKELSKLVVQAAERVTQKHAAEIEQERIQEQMQDPLILARQKELEIKEADVQRRAMTDQAKIQLETQKAIAKDALEKERIESQERIAGASIGQRIASDMQDSTRKDKELEIKQVQKIVDITKSMTEDSDRESE